MPLLKPGITRLRAFAPATSANLAVGFDILGLALATVGDSLTLSLRPDQQIVIEEITAVSGIPLEVSKNTASFALQAMCADLGIKAGFSISIDKGIALGSGMGGSAASAVAAVVALNGFLTTPLTKEQLVKYAMYGEQLASGALHADNVAPCIYGGLTLIRSIDPVEVISLPHPKLWCIIIHPHLQITTEAARKLLQPQIALHSYIDQAAHLAATICALFQKDIALLRRAMHDIIIEPQRAPLVPGYYAVKNAALQAGAITATFSGSGPSILALSSSKANATTISQAMLAEFAKNKIAAEYWIAPINSKGAHLI
jgi:homoserine kinase